MNKPEVESSATCTTITIGGMITPCKHKNGWYDSVERFMWVNRRVFICTDCYRIIDARKVEK